MRIAAEHRQLDVACPHCGAAIPASRLQTIIADGLNSGGVFAPGQAAYSRRSRVAAGFLGIFLGWIGAHRFYLGYPGIGVLQIVVSCLGYFLCLPVICFPLPISWIWGFVEGILCFTGGMKDADGLPLRD